MHPDIGTCNISNDGSELANEIATEIYCIALISLTGFKSTRALWETD